MYFLPSPVISRRCRREVSKSRTSASLGQVIRPADTFCERTMRDVSTGERSNRIAPCQAPA